MLDRRALPGETRMQILIYAKQVLVPLPCATLGVIGQVAPRLTLASSYDEDKVQRDS